MTGKHAKPDDDRSETGGEFLSRVGIDAAKWTDTFVKLNPGADWGTMVSWFANAIEAGRSAGRQEHYGLAYALGGDEPK